MNDRSASYFRGLYPSVAWPYYNLDFGHDITSKMETYLKIGNELKKFYKRENWLSLNILLYEK